MDILVWIVIGVVAAIVLGWMIYMIIRICKMKPEDRKELIVEFLVGLVTAAELAYTEHGMGEEKIKEVEEAFKEKAPWFLKTLLWVTKSADLDELIEKALSKARDAWKK